MKKVLGIDASTSTIGLGLLEFNDKNIHLLQSEYYKPPQDYNKKSDFIITLSEVQDYIINKIESFKPDAITIEDILLYMPFKTNAVTITKLAALNRVVCLSAYNTTGQAPLLYNVAFIRSILKINNKISKIDIPNIVKYHLNLKNYPFIKQRNKIIKENYDIADAIATALCYVVIERNGESHSQYIDVKKKKRTKRKK